MFYVYLTVPSEHVSDLNLLRAIRRSQELRTLRGL